LQALLENSKKKKHKPARIFYALTERIVHK
jgi:hypothetical protein